MGKYIFLRLLRIGLLGLLICSHRESMLNVDLSNVHVATIKTCGQGSVGCTSLHK